MRITKKTIVEAIEKSIENAEELFRDGELLESNERVTRAFTLFHFSSEEISKAYYGIYILIQNGYNNPKLVQDFKRLFKHHVFKLETSSDIDYGLAKYIETIDEDLARSIESNRTVFYDNASDYDKLKNKSLYTCFDQDSFKKPSDYINYEHVTIAKHQAELRVFHVKGMWDFIKPRIDEL